jgi:hypothetical protein
MNSAATGFQSLPRGMVIDTARHIIDCGSVDEAGRWPSVCQLAQRIQQQPPRAHDAQVGGAQHLLAAVGDRLHAGLRGGVLHPQARHAAVALCDLQTVVEAVGVPPVVLAPEQRVRMGHRARLERGLGRMAAVPALVPLLEHAAALLGQRLGRVVGEHQAQRVLVVHRHPGVAGELRILRLRRNQRVERQQELVDAHVVQVVTRLATRRDVDPAGMLHTFEGGHQVLGLPPLVDGAALVNPRMQDGRMRGVDLAFQRLQPVAFLDAHRHMQLLGGHQVPLQLRKRRRVNLRPHPGPQHAVALAHGVGLDLHVAAHRRAGRLGGDVQALAVDVELPAVVDAAQPVLLVAREDHGGGTVRAGMVHQADTAAGVAEGDEVLAQQAHAVRLAVGHHVGTAQERDPVQAHQRAHRRAGPDPHQALVVFAGKHG